MECVWAATSFQRSCSQRVPLWHKYFLLRFFLTIPYQHIVCVWAAASFHRSCSQRVPLWHKYFLLFFLRTIILEDMICVWAAASFHRSCSQRLPLWQIFSSFLFAHYHFEAYDVSGEQPHFIDPAPNESLSDSNIFFFAFFSLSLTSI